MNSDKSIEITISNSMIANLVKTHPKSQQKTSLINSYQLKPKDFTIYARIPIMRRNISPT